LAPERSRGDFVQSLERGLAVIKAFGPDRTRLTLTEVSQITGMTRAAARRFLLTLAQLGYVRSEGREFSLRPSILELGYAYLSGLELPAVAQPFMDEFVARVEESSSLAVLDNGQIVYIANVAPRRVMTINVRIGGRDPAYCTALGRVLLASRPDREIEHYLATQSFPTMTSKTLTLRSELEEALRRVAKDGYALIDGEYEEGLVALAMPIRDSSGTTVAAMNVSGYSLRTTAEVLESRCLPLLRESVLRIEDELRRSGVRIS
jgi:IclR family pca regulon transcriptional regulator